jgi:polyisoprenoid-binding protein YceI
MKTLSIFIIAVALGLSAQSQTTKWAFDTKHTNIGFSVAHMMISEVEGNFGTYDGTILSDKADFSDAKINFSIDVSSIDTDEPDRDKHLKSADFFNVEKFPTMIFEGKTMKSTGKNTYKLTGNLTMMGVLKSITLDVKYNGTLKDPYGNTKAGFKLSGTINRTDWGLKYNSVMDTGGVMIGEDISILCNIELKKM